MKRLVLKSKIHRVRVTGTHLGYEGSITLGPEYLEQADLVPYERVDIYNITNGARFSTYVIRGKPGEVILNGAAARLAQPGDLLIIAAYTWMDDEELKEFRPKVVIVEPGDGAA